jgi:hypothetical protein
MIFKKIYKKNKRIRSGVEGQVSQAHKKSTRVRAFIFFGVNYAPFFSKKKKKDVSPTIVHNPAILVAGKTRLLCFQPKNLFLTSKTHRKHP